MRPLKIVLLLITLLCISNTVSADTALIEPSVKLLSEYYTNSSHFTRKGIGAEFGAAAFGDLNFDAGYVLSEFSQDEFDDILRHTFFIQGEKQFSERVGLLVRLSVNLYDNDNTNLNGGVFLRYQPVTNVFTEFSFRHYDLIDLVQPFNNVIYSHVVTIGSLDRDIQSDDYKFYILYAPVSKVSLAGEAVYGRYSDHNEKRSLMFETGYQIFDKPFLRVAYNYFYLDIKDPAPLTRNGKKNESAYWDPVNFETHTIRLEFKRDHNEQISYGAEAGLSYSPKSKGFSKAAFLFASYKITEQTSLRFDARWFDQNKGIDRLGETGNYWATNYNLMLQYRF